MAMKRILRTLGLMPPEQDDDGDDRRAVTQAVDDVDQANERLKTSVDKGTRELRDTLRALDTMIDVRVTRAARGGAEKHV
jgi:hypothetical protein